MKKERFITKLVGGFFLWFNVMVNFEVGFLFDVGAFGEFLFACPKRNQKRHASLIAPQGKRRPAHNGLYYFLPDTFGLQAFRYGSISTTYCLMPIDRIRVMRRY
jgi:hypothetical protein